MKNQHAKLCHLKCSCRCKLADWARVPSLFEVCTYENIACRVLADVLLSLFPAG